MRSDHGWKSVRGSSALLAAAALAVGLVSAVPVAAQAVTTHTVSGTIYDAYGGQPESPWYYVKAMHPGGSVGDDVGSSFTTGPLVPGSVTLWIGDHAAGSETDPNKIVYPFTLGDADVAGLVFVYEAAGTMPQPTNAGGIALQGQLLPGQTLSLNQQPQYAGTPGVVDFNGDRHYIWWCGETRIDGANGASYTLTAADVGCTIEVTVVAHPTATVAPAAGQFGTPTFTVTATAAVSAPAVFGDPTVTGTASATAPVRGVSSRMLALSFTGTTHDENPSVSYTLSDGQERVPLPVLLMKNPGMTGAAVRPPVLEPGTAPVQPGVRGVAVALASGTTPGRYRVDVPVTRWLYDPLANTSTPTTKVAGHVLTVSANPAVSKAKTSLKRGARTVAVSAPAYQSGATVILYDRTRGHGYQKVGTAKLKASGSMSKASIRISKKHNRVGAHRFYVRIGAVPFSPKYQSAVQHRTIR